MVQPPLSSPTRLLQGTRTLSKNTSQNSSSPAMLRIGRTVMPREEKSIRIKLIPACGLASGSVRTRQNIQFASCARVVQIFCPLITNSSPSRTALVRNEARSDPAFGSE